MEPLLYAFKRDVKIGDCPIGSFALKETVKVDRGEFEVSIENFGRSQFSHRVRFWAKERVQSATLKYQVTLVNS